MADRPVAIFAAKEQEALALVRHLPRSETIGPRISIWEGDGMVVAVVGAGKVASALAAQFACDVFKPRCLVSVGVARPVRADQVRGEIIVATAAAPHDLRALNMSAFGAEAPLAEKLLVAAKRAVENPRVVRSGLVLTGDQIIATRALRDALARDFPDAACVDMETAAIAQVAHQNGLPWGAVRVSDAADETFDAEDVINFGVNTAGELFARILGESVGDL